MTRAACQQQCDLPRLDGPATHPISLLQTRRTVLSGAYPWLQPQGPNGPARRSPLWPSMARPHNQNQSPICNRTAPMASPGAGGRHSGPQWPGPTIGTNLQHTGSSLGGARAASWGTRQIQAFRPGHPTNIITYSTNFPGWPTGKVCTDPSVHNHLQQQGPCTRDRDCTPLIHNTSRWDHERGKRLYKCTKCTLLRRSLASI